MSHNVCQTNVFLKFLNNAFCYTIYLGDHRYRYEYHITGLARPCKQSKAHVEASSHHMSDRFCKVCAPARKIADGTFLSTISLWITSVAGDLLYGVEVGLA
jgi:hypothetical protein